MLPPTDPALYKAKIVFFQGPVLEKSCHGLQPYQGLSCHDQAAGIPVQAVADGRAECPQFLLRDAPFCKQIGDHMLHHGHIVLCGLLGQHPRRLIDE